MNTVRVCAIILDYFGADKTEICLKSLIGQGIEKICLVDNSTVQDASTNLHAAVNRVRTNADYEIEIFTTGENLGFAKGVNYALDHEANNESPHDYYLIINNDAVAGPGLVSGLVFGAPERAPSGPRRATSRIERSQPRVWDMVSPLSRAASFTTREISLSLLYRLLPITATSYGSSN